MSDRDPNEEQEKPSPGSSKTAQPVSPKIMAFLSKLQDNHPFFSEMRAREIQEFLGQCQSESFAEGEVIFEKGTMGDKFYLIVSGDVLILPGKGKFRLEPGNVFGEMAILDLTARTATARAATAVELFSVHRDILLTDMASLRSKIAVGIAKQLSEKLSNANRIIARLSERLNETLKEIAGLS